MTSTPRYRSLGAPFAVAALLAGAAACTAGGEVGPEGGRRPVVLLVVDTLRADRLGAYGHERPTSPEIDAWAREGRLYERALATSPWTLPSFGSLFTGQYPTRHGCGYRKDSLEEATGDPVFTAIDGTVDTLAEILRGQGYATGAVVTNTFLRPVFELNRGFDTYDCVAADNLDTRRADETVDRALAWMDDHGSGPFFLLVHFFDPHVAYDAPAPFRGVFTKAHDSDLTLPIAEFRELRQRAATLDEEDRAFVAAAYDEEVAFVDREVGRLLAALEERGVLDRGLVLLTSDHGEELFEHGGFEHGHAMWQELLHVPLVVWGDGVRPGREDAPVSLVDLAPTILDFVGVERDRTAGVSLRANLTREAALASRTLYAEGVYYGPRRQSAIRWPDKLVVDMETGEARLYDLRDDPGEVRDLAGSRAAIVAGLEEGLRRRLRRELRERVRHEAFEVDPDTAERLRRLGYLD